MYSSKLLKGDVPGVKEFIQNLLITPEAKQYDQYDKNVNNHSKQKSYIRYDVCMTYTSSQK